MRSRSLEALARRFVGALRDLAPIVLVIAFFQIAVLQQPFPNLAGVAVGLVCVVAGLALFIQGLELGLFPWERPSPKPSSPRAARPRCWCLPSALDSVPWLPNRR